MNPLNDPAVIINYHRMMVGTYGMQSSLALGWRDMESQLVRFEALAGIAGMSGCSVLDAGCGYGDLLPYLISRYGQLNYTGIEQIPEFLDEASKRYGKYENAVFMNGNFALTDLPRADYVLASGSLNYRSEDPDFIFRVIAKLYSACLHGFAFNLLRAIVPNGLLVAYNCEKIMACCSKLCPNVKLVNDYAEEDFTIYMLR
ncbi:class I SAM-dependent methyltransferase [Mucilaginibacter gotjawali]|uniref:Trans-aconitate 2-methyltransferase n=2 Tax=Mucilaginibacter gotjawali TaxID=1550579 RepID=A0A0X8X4P5_9SPHI|nr:class I SAM-dependent methyltransferase [Mucilaginibacter gotjawali]MBB3056334.1 SAM-dependent methyltransferase [Mucilaginibacter gotjawali]BAU55038.1 Trans-aconitate 2-methyltransferase [Mucilaginibacter gotjawali]